MAITLERKPWNINARLKRLEQILIASAGAIILLLINTTFKLH
jgi:hypothetical protein